MSKFITLSDQQLPVMFDYSYEWKHEGNMDCECDSTCYPKFKNIT